MNGRFNDEAPAFQIFRGESGRPCDLIRDDAVVSGETTVPETAGLEEALSLDQGSDLKVLFDMPGLSLVRVWFKSGYPLPRHTHDVDCLYYITGGSLRMGQEVLRAGDGFFVGADVPYAYIPGEEGVELLEIRPSNSFDIQVKGDRTALAERFARTVASCQSKWSGEISPPLAGER